LPKVESANVKIVGMTGKIVSNRDFKSIANNEIEIGLDSLKKGVYFFIVTTQK
jgi:hypothetical protein